MYLPYKPIQCNVKKKPDESLILNLWLIFIINYMKISSSNKFIIRWIKWFLFYKKKLHET
jgi:hypothetical protein